jgi:hypothetical protein
LRSGRKDKNFKWHRNGELTDCHDEMAKNSLPLYKSSSLSLFFILEATLNWDQTINVKDPTENFLIQMSFINGEAEKKIPVN